MVENLTFLEPGPNAFVVVDIDAHKHEEPHARTHFSVASPNIKLSEDDYKEVIKKGLWEYLSDVRLAEEEAAIEASMAARQAEDAKLLAYLHENWDE
jgi:hypothetical protein